MSRHKRKVTRGRDPLTPYRALRTAVNLDADTESVLQAWFGSKRDQTSLLAEQCAYTSKVLAGAAAEARREARRQLELPLLHLDFCISLVANIWILAQILSEHGHQILWPSARGDSRRGRAILVSHLSNFVNSLVALRVLASDGLGLQARQLFRSHVEAGDVLLAMVGDETFCDRYLAWPTGEYREITDYWRQHIAPGKVRDLLADVLRRAGYNKGLVKSSLENRRDLYGWLSTYNHAHPYAVYVGANERCASSWRTSLGGRVGTNTEALADRITDYNYETLAVLLVLLLEHQGWFEPLRDLQAGKDRDLVRTLVLQRAVLPTLSILVHPVSRRKRRSLAREGGAEVGSYPIVHHYQ